MNTEELKKLAKAVINADNCGDAIESAVEFMKAAGPQEFLALIAERDELLAALKDARRELAYAGRQEAHDAASAAIAKGGEV